MSIRDDMNKAIATSPATRDALKGRHIALTGGTGFLGSWIAEAVAALNDEHALGLHLHSYARHTDGWARKFPHLSARNDVTLVAQDVRSTFEFPASTHFVIHAAGIPDNRVHASDPLRVFETTVQGMQNSLEAAVNLPELRRFVNISSGLVERAPPDAGKIHAVYADAKRAAETVCAIYRSQHRLPVSTLRPFTFIGPYQELDRPWAVNNFIRDALSGHEIRLHGEGNIKRSYLYGSDAAWWTLSSLIHAGDGRHYHLGSAEAITHQSLAEAVAAKVAPAPDIVLRTMPSQQHHHDFLPDLTATLRELQVTQTCLLDNALTRTIDWHRARKN